MPTLKKHLNLIIAILIFAISIVCGAFFLGNANSYKNSWKSGEIVSSDGLVQSYAVLELEKIPTFAYANVGGVYGDESAEIILSFNVSEDNLVSGKVIPNGTYSKNYVNFDKNSQGWVNLLSEPAGAKYVKFGVKGEISVNEVVFLDEEENLINFYVLGQYVSPSKGYEMIFDYKNSKHALNDAQNSFSKSLSRFNKLYPFEKEFAFSVETFLAGNGYVSENVSPLGVIINSLGVLIFKNSVFSARIIPFIFSLVSVFLLLTIGYGLLGEKNKILNLAVLSIISCLIVFAGFFLNSYVISLPFVILALYFIVKNFKNEFNYSKSLVNFLLSGFFMALAIAITSKFAILVLFEIVLVVLFARKKVEKPLFSRVVLIGVVSFTVIPLISYMFSTFFAFSVYSSFYGTGNILELTFKNFIKTLF